MPTSAAWSLSGQSLSSRSSLSALTQTPARPQRLAGFALRTEAAAVSRKQKTQKRHKAIRNKVVDDERQHTLAAASTLSPEIRSQLNGSGGSNKEAAEMVGRKIAELCLQNQIQQVCFDRGGNIYHGRVQALAEAARGGGLQF